MTGEENDETAITVDYSDVEITQVTQNYGAHICPDGPKKCASWVKNLIADEQRQEEEDKENKAIIDVNKSIQYFLHLQECS